MKVLVCKKKKVVLFLAVLIFLFFIVLSLFSEQILEVNSTPATNKIVILDAGHGIPDYGTQSASGTTEQELIVTTDNGQIAR